MLVFFQSQSHAEVLAVNKREYWCPLCRQLSNAVIPIVPEERNPVKKKSVSKEPKQMLLELADLIVKPSRTSVSIHTFTFLCRYDLTMFLICVLCTAILFNGSYFFLFL